MSRRIIITGFLLLTVAFNSYADDGDRIGQLEKQVQELQLRVSKLEALLNKSDATPGKPDAKIGKPEATKDGVTPGEGLKSILSWKELSSGMSHEDVRKILGDPSRTRGGDRLETWNYPDSGYVMFKHGKVFRWTEPSQ